MHQRALLFDWGGTLMERMPCYMGKGQGWSYVEGTLYAAEIVQNLSGQWLTALASNAGESDEQEIRIALDDMDLGHVFDRIYTYRLIGRPKPQAFFWNYILHDLQLPADSVVMVGDDYMADVWGANQVGIRGIWFNRWSTENHNHMMCRTIYDFRELPGQLAALGFDTVVP